MAEQAPKTNILGFEDLQVDFLSLRIGEEIPRLEIREIRKITNSRKPDNLPGVNYKYVIESTDGKLLTVNSWVLWNRIAAVLREAGTIEATLELKHHGREDYEINIVDLRN